MLKSDSKFISLKEAADFCDYSADYLKLRARQGKLRAEKIGRLWVTKKKWLEDYIEQTKVYWQERKEGKSPVEAVESVSAKFRLRRLVRPKLEQDFEIEIPFSAVLLQSAKSFINAKLQQGLEIEIPSPALGLASAVLIFVLLVTSIAFSKESFAFCYYGATKIVEDIKQDISFGAKGFVFSVSQSSKTLKTISSDLGADIIFGKQSFLAGFQQLSSLPQTLVSNLQSGFSSYFRSERVGRKRVTFLFSALENKIFAGFKTLGFKFEQYTKVIGNLTSNVLHQAALIPFYISSLSNDISDLAASTTFLIKQGFSKVKGFFQKQTMVFSPGDTQSRINNLRSYSLHLKKDANEYIDSIGNFSKSFANFLKSKTSGLVKVDQNQQDRPSFRQKVSLGVKNFGSSVENFFGKVKSAFRQMTQSVVALFKRGPEKLIPEPTKEGMVVTLSTEKDGELKERIKKTFSDEVRVEIEDETSGIITPVFRERDGEDYLYILVPIQHEQQIP